MSSTKTSEQNSLKNGAEKNGAPDQVSAENKTAEQRLKFRLTPPGYKYSPLKIWVPIILESLVGILIVCMPLWVASVISEMIAGHTASAAWRVSGIFVLILFLSLNEMVGWRLTSSLMAELERDWKEYAFSLFTKHEKAHDAGHIISIINQDARQITFMWQNVPAVCGALSLAMMGTVQLWAISVPVACVSLAGITLTITMLTLTSNALEKRADTRREKISLSAASATDIATALRTISGLGAQRIMMSRFRKSTENLRAAQLEYQRVESWTFALNVFLVGLTTLCGIGLALRGEVVDGRWVTDVPASKLISIAGIITLMTGPIWVVQMMLWLWRQAKVALKRIQELDQPETEEAIVAEINAVSPQSLLHYINPRENNLTAQEYANALVHALRKSEMANAGQGYGDQGTNKRILASEPNPMIFQGTLRQLLTAGTTGHTDAELIELLTITDSLEIANRLGGIDPQHFFAANISSEGANLSGGQKQRLALARALAQSASVLVLCEPVNSVDEPSQQFILDQLEQHLGEHPQLAHFEQIYLISTTAEVQRRIDAAPHRLTQHGTAAHQSETQHHMALHQHGATQEGYNS